jgi:hypothetical protein
LQFSFLVSIFGHVKTNIRQMTRKYRIEEILESLSYRDYKAAKKELPELLGISDRQFHRILKMSADDSSEAKPAQLQAVALYLGVTVDELLSNSQVLS